MNKLIDRFTHLVCLFKISVVWRQRWIADRHRTGQGEEIKQLRAYTHSALMCVERKVNRANAHAYTHTSRYHYPSGILRARKRNRDWISPLSFALQLYSLYITFFLLTACCCCLLILSSLLLLVVLIVSSTTLSLRLRDDDDDDVFVVLTLTSTVVVVVVVVNKVVSFSLSIDVDNCCFIVVIVLLQSIDFCCIWLVFSSIFEGDIWFEFVNKSVLLFRGIVKRRRLAESVCVFDCDDDGGELIIIILDKKQMSSEKQM